MSDIHEGFRKKKAWKSFASISCTNEMTSKNCLANGWKVYFSHVSLSDFPTANCFIFPAVKTTLRHRIFYNAKYVNLSKEYIIECKNGVCLNSGSLRTLAPFSLRIEDGALLTNRAVQVSFQDQHCGHFSVK